MPQSKRILLVEGVNDAHIILNILGANKISAAYKKYKTQTFEELNSIEIRDKGGVEEVKKFDKLLLSLETEIKANQDFLGMVVDADASLDSRWQSLANRLKDVGYTNVPKKPADKGLVLESKDFLPKLGVWVMPNNKLLGKIENFLRLLVSDERETLWALVEKTVDEIPDNQRLFAEKDVIKAQIHTFLAWQIEPGRPMGEAITRRYFDSDTQEAQKFVD